MTESIHDIIKARRAREESLAQVLSPEDRVKWCNGLLFRIKTMLPTGYEGTAEEIMRQVGMPAPYGAPNAIGATFKTASKRGLLVATGQYRAPESVKSHASKTQVWRRT